MISPEILKSVRPENVKSLWPRIVDIDEAQFWDKIYWARQLRFIVTDVWKSERLDSDLEKGWEYVSGEEGDFVVRVLEGVVKGWLTSDDPSFFLRDGSDMVLIWPFSVP